MKALGLFIEESVRRHASQDHCAFNHPLGDDKLLRLSESYSLAMYHLSKNRLSSLLQVTHPSFIAALADRFRHNLWRLPFPFLRFPKCVCAYGNQKSFVPLELLDDSHQPLRPYMLSRIDSTATKDTLFHHWRLDREEETKDQEGRGNSHPEAGRLFQQSEEGRHAFSDQRKEVVTAQTAPSHPRGDCTATHTRRISPEGAS